MRKDRDAWRDRHRQRNACRRTLTRAAACSPSYLFADGLLLTKVLRKPLEAGDPHHVVVASAFAAAFLQCPLASVSSGEKRAAGGNLTTIGLRHPSVSLPGAILVLIVARVTS